MFNLRYVRILVLNVFCFFQTLYTYPQNFRAYKALIAARYSGADVKVDSSFKFGETNKSADFLAKFPLGKVNSRKKLAISLCYRAWYFDRLKSFRCLRCTWLHHSLTHDSPLHDDVSKTRDWDFTDNFLVLFLAEDSKHNVVWHACPPHLYLKLYRTGQYTYHKSF